MLINNFSKGLNTRLAPHLLDPASAAIYSNIDNDRGVLSPVKLPVDLHIDSYRYFHKFEDTYVSSPNERSYTEFQEVLYWSEINTTAKKYVDGVTSELGIATPVGSIMVDLVQTVGQSGTVGTYTYYVTYYDDIHDIESKPLKADNDITTNTGNIPRLNNMPVSTDLQVNTIRIYRIGGTLTSRTLVIEFPNGRTSFEDSYDDIDVDGFIMESEAYDKAPDGLMHLIEHNSGLVGAVGNKVYFTPIANPNAWPALDYITVPSVVTGVSSASIGLLVFTAKTTYAIVGTEFSSYSKYLFDGSQGCVNHHTIAKLGGAVLWVSNDGICTIAESKVSVVSRPILASVGTPINAVVHNDVYYLQLEDKILAIDSRFGLIFKEFGYQFDRLGMFDDVLYGVRNGSIHTLFSSHLTEDFDWLSAEFGEGAMTHKKIYYGVYFNSIGRLTVEILIDGRSAQFQPLGISGITEILLPQELQNGYSIQFRVRGKGVLKEIEYKVQGRANDR